MLVDSTGLQAFGAAQWLQEKHGVKSRRSWRKLHLAVDAGPGQIVAHTLTDQEGDDPSQVAPLLEQIPGELGRFIADGAYDGAPTYQTVAQHSAAAQIVIPPRSSAVRSCETGPPTQRDRHLEAIAAQGRLGWQKPTGYGRRALVETTMGRYKALIGPRLHARDPDAQQTEAAIGVAVLNRMLAAARPKSVRCRFMQHSPWGKRHVAFTVASMHQRPTRVLLQESAIIRWILHNPQVWLWLLPEAFPRLVDLARLRYALRKRITAARKPM